MYWEVIDPFTTHWLPATTGIPTTFFFIVASFKILTKNLPSNSGRFLTSFLTNSTVRFKKAPVAPVVPVQGTALETFISGPNLFLDVNS